MKPRSYSRRYVGVFLLFGLLLAMFLIYQLSRPEALSFNPEPGDSRDYRVDLHMRITEDGARPSRYEDVVSLQSLLRYRVAGVEPLQMHVQPRFMSISDGYNTATSASPGPLRDAEVKGLMSEGFDLTIDDSHTSIQAVNQQAWRSLLEQSGEEMEAQMRQQIMVPAVTSAIPAQEDAEVSVQGFQGMPPLSLKVESVDDDGITVGLTNEAGGATLALGAGTDEITTQITDVKGRMHLSREGGWVESMVLISSQQLEAQGRKVNVRAVLSVHAVQDPAAIPVELSLKAGQGIARIMALVEDIDMRLSQTPREPELFNALKPASAPFAKPEASLTVDEEEGRIQLMLNLDIPSDEILGENVGLSKLSLYNAEGKMIDVPMVLEEIRPEGTRKVGFLISLLATGWEKPDLEKIARAEAVLHYRLPTEPTRVALPLGEKATEIHQGNATAQAIPTDTGWRVVLKSNDYDIYILDLTAAFPGLTVSMGSSPFEGMTAVERSLLRGVNESHAWERHYVLQGDGDQVGLLFIKGTPVTKTSPISFMPEKK